MTLNWTITSGSLKPCEHLAKAQANRQDIPKDDDTGSEDKDSEEDQYAPEETVPVTRTISGRVVRDANHSKSNERYE
eukprot:jgi/Psemu1/19579/gm1.19579_g